MSVKENRDVVAKIITALNETQAYQESVIRDEVNDWLDDHPEATTTVEDGVVSYAKLDSSLQESVDKIDVIASEINPLNPLQIDGVVIADGTDLMEIAEVTLGGYYSKSAQDTVKWNDSDSYNAAKIKAKPGTYTANANIRFTICVDSSDNILYYSSSNITTFAAPSDTAYIYVSVSTALWSSFKIGYGPLTPSATKYEWSKLQETLAKQIDGRIYGAGFAKATGNLGNGDILMVPRTNCKKNNIYSFFCDITTLDKIRIGHGGGTYDTSYIDIDSTKVTTHNFVPSDATEEYTHGLTISGYLHVLITVKVGKADIELFSGGERYIITNADWTGDANGNTYVSSDGSTLTNCVLVWSSNDYKKPVWIYGDSYLGMLSDERWVYYLMQHGYGDNVMLNAYPGEDSGGAWVAISNGVTNYGKPKFVIWCMGMNDGSDTDINTPSSTWMTGINRMLSVCETYEITPILATIPTVPTINHEGKNKYVRESGYRYIDFAKAVGAQSDGTWYADMLSSDNVHPTEEGAQALFYQALMDAPEITFSNP